MADNYKDLQQTIARLNAAEYSFCMQQAKVGYLKKVDHNSSFFHAPVKRNNRLNEITVVEKLDVILKESFDEVVQVFIDYYQRQLGTIA